MNRLREKKKSDNAVKLENPSTSQSRPKRQELQVNFEQCMFCQSCNTAAMRNVATMMLSNRILESAKSDPTMRIRLANVVDLVAAEAKYHLKCLVQFDRRVKKQAETPDQKTDAALNQLCDSLQEGLCEGQVFDMAKVWKQYKDLCERENISMPPRYLSRRKSFYDDVQKKLGTNIRFLQPLDVKGSLLMYQSGKADELLTKYLTSNPVDSAESSSDSDDSSNPNTLNDDNKILNELVHTALKIRSDLEKTPGHSAAWGGIDQEHVKYVIPDSLYMFLSVLLGGLTMLDTEEAIDSLKKSSVCSIAQDIVFAVSNRKKLTPKHIGLGLALHQATRSKILVNLFHAAGHTINIDTIRRIDTSIATEILARFEQNGNVYVPPDIVPSTPGKMVISSCDNIDVLEETLDGKNTFHCTQMMMWQRGPPPEYHVSAESEIGKQKALQPEVLKPLHELDRAKPLMGSRPAPVVDETKIDIDAWFQKSAERDQACSKNLAWLLSRMQTIDNQHVPSWSAFNETCSAADPPITVAGMMPILQAQADENDTMVTVINKFRKVSEHLGQSHTVIVADQPLYSRAKELIWANPDDFPGVIMVQGHLHVLFNFLKVIGKHIESAGLEDIWVESGLFAPNSINAIMEGKAYYRAVRGHTLAYEALWRIRWKLFEAWLEESTQKLDDNTDIDKVVSLLNTKQSRYDEATKEAVEHSASILLNGSTMKLLEEFNIKFAEQPNFKFWSTYLELVEILLDFIRANREGNWTLHLDSFEAMLPWMSLYDHVNYARWGPVYLTDMKELPFTAPEVHREFQMGNFVVKRSSHHFNQVPVDQATEWINGMCKVSNGIIGITRNDPARDRFCVTWAERSHIAHKTRALFDQNEKEESISMHKEALPSRLHQDEQAVQKLVEEFKRNNAFNVIPTSTTDADSIQAAPPALLMSLATHDVASEDITNDLLTANERGVVQVKNFVRDRLVEKKVNFFDPVKRNNSKTFATLYKAKVITKRSEAKTIKADRKLIQKLLNASQAGRQVEMEEVLKHELSVLPLSLVKSSGQMNATSKSDMLQILTKDLGIEISQVTPH